MWWCIVHLFRLAKDAYDANPSILKCKIKGGSAHSCKTVFDRVFGSGFVKGVEELHALQIFYEMKWNYSQVWVTSRTQLIAVLNSIPKWWKAGQAEGCLLQIHHRPWKSKLGSDINSNNSKQEGLLDILQWFYHRAYRKIEMNRKRCNTPKNYNNHSCMSDSLIDPWPENHFSPIAPTRNCGQEVTHSAVQFTANLPLALTVHTCFIRTHLCMELSFDYQIFFFFVCHILSTWDQNVSLPFLYVRWNSLTLIRINSKGNFA